MSKLIPTRRSRASAHMVTKPDPDEVPSGEGVIPWEGFEGPDEGGPEFPGSADIPDSPEPEPASKKRRPR